MSLSHGTLYLWPRVKPYWKYLSSIDVDPGVAHVVFVGFPIYHFAIVVGMLRKVFRECGFQDPRDPFALVQLTVSRDDGMIQPW